MNMPLEYSTLLVSITDHFSAMPDLPEDTPESILNALWILATGKHVSAHASQQEELSALSNTETARLSDYIERWKAGEPLAHITERQNFCGLEFVVGKQALIPRRETELLANEALAKIGGVNKSQPVVLDVCTGCGNLAIVIKNRFKDAVVYASDLSQDAVDLAERNAEYHHLKGRITFTVGDLLSPFEEMGLYESVDVMTCNPPYISSKKVSTMTQVISFNEPTMAFDGGPFGVSILQRLISESQKYLTPGGWLIFEVGVGQGPSIAKRLDRSGDFINLETTKDQSGEIRVIAAQRPKQVKT